MRNIFEPTDPLGRFALHAGRFYMDQIDRAIMGGPAMSCREEPADCGAHRCEEAPNLVRVEMVIEVPKKFTVDDDILMLFVDRELRMRGLSCDCSADATVERPKEPADDAEPTEN